MPILRPRIVNVHGKYLISNNFFVICRGHLKKIIITLQDIDYQFISKKKEKKVGHRNINDVVESLHLLPDIDACTTYTYTNTSASMSTSSNQRIYNYFPPVYSFNENCIFNV